MTQPHSIPMPEISPDFSVDDIHRIREWNHLRRKHMTVEERCADVNQVSEKVQREIETFRNAKLN